MDPFTHFPALQSSSNARFEVMAFFPAYWLQWSGYVASLVLDLRQALERLETAPDMYTKV